jgi:hypothetical protein
MLTWKGEEAIETTVAPEAVTWLTVPILLVLVESFAALLKFTADVSYP